MKSVKKLQIGFPIPQKKVEANSPVTKSVCTDLYRPVQTRKRPG